MPHQLRALRHHETATAVYIGWGGWKNGALLKAAEDAGFEVLVTGDAALQHQQNMSGRKIALVSLSAHSWRIIQDHVAKIVAAVDAASAGSIKRVDCGTFARANRRPK
jgi:hypothetical protein